MASGWEARPTNTKVTTSHDGEHFPVVLKKLCQVEGTEGSGVGVEWLRGLESSQTPPTPTNNFWPQRPQRHYSWTMRFSRTLGSAIGGQDNKCPLFHCFGEEVCR
jgi:hypothetical protein